jgi:K+-transporting ATPase c subunit
MIIGSGEYPVEILGIILMVVLIVYTSHIPLSYRVFMDSMTGRILAIVSIFATVKFCGWLYGLLVAVAYLVILHTVANGSEGFTNQIVKETIGKRWYVERVLGERPELIDTEKVTTTSVTDNSQRGMSRSL